MQGYIDKLVEKKAFGADDELFNNAMLECFEFHVNNCLHYRKFCEKSLPVKTAGDIPPILVTALKHYALLSVPKEEVVLALTSSGTGGQKTRLCLNKRSLENLQKMAENVHAGMGLVNKRQEVNYLCFAYDPKYARDLGTTWSDKNSTSFTKVHEIFYALQWNGKDFFFDREGTIEYLKRYAEEDLPLRILGFPAYIFNALEELKKVHGSLNFGKESYVLSGGGWKGKKGAISKERFRKELSETLGIPEENVRDCYGLAEHGVPYVECSKGNMHIPIYSKVIVRDPLTLKRCKEGEIGLLQLMTPYNLTTPHLSVLTTDYGTVRSDCDCGIETPYIKIKSRAGLKKHVGCAISALDHLKSN
ncbi:MAG TPA: acyl-protein synthetase [Thermoplasmata archaeon]|nr:acyl-protein synthetase [Thermoplasmata archaeon]